MGQVRIAGFSIPLEGFGAGPEQSLQDPLGSAGRSSTAGSWAPRPSGPCSAGRAAQIGHAVAGGATQTVLHSVPPANRAQASAAIHIAFTSGMNDILLVAGIVALAGAVLSLVLVRGRDFAAYGAREAAAAPAAG